ncbi:toprim domain-containing protein [Candidatus Bathyarchaeota archaeon]|nr:toprim domain-containing protein [Candidatus Bathyarchaeota archaeon]
MSAHLKNKEAKILQILDCLAEESAAGIPIIVEGKKDAEALRALGVKGRIISAKTGGKASLDVVSEVEKTEAKEVILLLDFDRRGRELTRNLEQYLEKTGTKPNIQLWRALSSILGTEVKDVEGLVSYMETLKRKTSNS